MKNNPLALDNSKKIKTSRRGFLAAMGAAASSLALKNELSRADEPTASKNDENPLHPAGLEFYPPTLKTGNRNIDLAFRTAIGDLIGNVCPYKNAILGKPAPAILAGIHYDSPWTRDAAINVWNGASLIIPAASRNTLTSVLNNSKDTLRIGGEYWDAIIWATGAWQHYLYTGDKEFLALAFKAVKNSLEHFEATEFDADDNLFRGPACYGDGVAAYPDIYTKTANRRGNIGLWPRANPDKIAKPGVGLPMKSLSTNCLYYNAYVMLSKMASVLGVDAPAGTAEKAEKLKSAINKNFWMPDKGRYFYLKDPFGNCDHQEGLGHSFVVLLGVADAEQTEAVFKNQFISPAGIPCVWPTFARYQKDDPQAFGRHSGTVWPHIQGFWAEAAAKHKKTDVFAHELFKLAEFANRDGNFAELYHPLTGQMYGGLQENQDTMKLWDSCKRQTWAATAYLRMVLMCLCGMNFDTDGIRFNPCVPKELSKINLAGLRYRDCEIEIAIDGAGTEIKEFFIDGQAQKDAFLPVNSSGKKVIRIVVG